MDNKTNLSEKELVEKQYEVNHPGYMKEKDGIQDASEEDPIQKRRVRNYKLMVTVCTTLLWACMGFYDALFGPSLIDMRDRLQANTDQITFARAFKEIGRMVGGLFGGIASDRFQSYSLLMLGSGLLLAGASVISQPWSHFLPILGGLYFLEGTAQGSMDSVGNALIANMWGAKADPAMHSIHFGYTVGSSLTPLMSANFLSPEKDLSNCTAVDNFTTMCPEMSTAAPIGFFDDASQIEIAYGIAGTVTCAMGLIFVIVHCIGPPTGLTMHSPKKGSLKEVFSPGSCAGGRSSLGAFLVFLLVMFYVLIQAQGSGMWMLNFTYAVESDLKFDKQKASLMDFTGKVCALASRGVLIVASRWIKPQFILFYSVGGSAIAVALVAFLGVTDQTLFWVFTSIYSFVMAGAWGAAYAFIDKYIVLYAFVVALTSVGAGLAGFAFQTLHGYLYENTIKESYFYLSFAMTVVWLVCTIIMWAVALKLGYRHGKSDDIENEEGLEPEDIMGISNAAYEKDAPAETVPTDTEKVVYSITASSGIEQDNISTRL